MKLRPILAGCALLVAAACSQKSTPPLNEPKAYPASPVPPPDGLVAELSLRGPDALWGKLQLGVAGPLGHLPQTIGGALATVAHLDVSLAGEVDGAAPAYGAITENAGQVDWTAALKLREFDHARATLLGGKTPLFSAREVAGGTLVLTPVKSKPDQAFIVALSPLGYLLVADSEAAALALGPYATRTLPTRKETAHALVVSVPHAALAGVIHERVVAVLKRGHDAAVALDESLREDHAGKAPDFGDPRAVIAWLDGFLAAKAEVLADLDHAELTLDAGDDDLDVEVLAVPGKGPSASAFDGIPSGDASPLLSLSAATTFAALFRDDPATRENVQKEIEDRTAAIFKSELREVDLATLHRAATDWSAARGPWLTLGIEDAREEGHDPSARGQPTPPPKGGVATAVRTLSPDPGKATAAVSELVELSRVPVFRRILDAKFGIQANSTATVEVPGAGSTSIASFRVKNSRRGNSDVAVAWSAPGGLLRVGVGTSSALALEASKDPPALLGRDVPLAGKLGTLRDRASLVLLGRPSLEETQGASGPRSSFVVGLGRDHANGWGMLEVDDAVLRTWLVSWLND